MAISSRPTGMPSEAALDVAMQSDLAAQAPTGQAVEGQQEDARAKALRQKQQQQSSLQTEKKEQATAASSMFNDDAISKAPFAFFDPQLAALEAQADLPPTGGAEATKLFAELAEHIDPAKVPSPDEVPASFSINGLEHQMLSDLVVLPPQATALFTGAQVIDQRLAQLRPEQAKRIEHIKQLLKVMNAQSEGASEQSLQTMQTRTQLLSQETQQRLATAVPKIAEMYKTYLQLPAKGPAKKAVDDLSNEVPEIPSPQLVAMEQVATEMVSIVKSAAQAQTQALDDGGAATGNATGTKGTSGSGASTKLASAGSAKAALSQGTLGTLGGIPYMTGAVSKQMILTLDIDALMIVVMMSATKVEEDLLRDQLAQMAMMTEKKKQLREVKTKMKQEQARLEGQMMEEFNILKNAGMIASDKTFEDYKTWRQCQWADVQTDPVSGQISWPPAQLTQPSPPSDLPDWLTMTAEEMQAKGAEGDTANLTGLSDMTGLPKAVLNMLEKIYNALDPKPTETFDAYLRDELGLTMPPTDVATVKQNLTDAMEAISNYKEDHLADAAQPISMQMVSPGGVIYKAMEEMVKAAALAAAFPDDNTLNTKAGEKRNELTLLLKGKFDSEITKTMYGKMVTEITEEAIEGLTEMKTKAEKYFKVGDGGGPGAAGFSESEDPLTIYITEDNETISFDSLDDAVDKPENEYGAEASTDMEDVFNEGYAWRTQAEYNKNEESGMGGYGEGYSWPTGFSWGSDGATAYGGFQDCDDDEERGTLTITGDISTNDWVDSLTNGLGDRVLGGNDKESFMRQVGDMIESVTEITTNYAAGGALAPKEVEAIDGSDGLPTEAELDRWLGDCQEKLDEMDDPDSGYSQWLTSKDYDGELGKAQAEADQEAQEDAAEKAARKERNTGKTTLDDAKAAVALDQTGGIGELEAFAQEVDDQLQSLSEMSEIEMMRTQMMMDRRSKFIEALSNLIKKVDQTMGTVVSNLK